MWVNISPWFARFRPTMVLVAPLTLAGIVCLLYFGVIRLDASDELIILLRNNEELEARSGHIANVIAAVEGALSMLLTIHIGLFIIIGFSFNFSDRPSKVSKGIYVSSLVFMILSLFSLYYGFVTRLQLIERTSAGSLVYDAVISSLATQGLWLGLASSVAVGISVSLLTGKDKLDG